MTAICAWILSGATPHQSSAANEAAASHAQARDGNTPTGQHQASEETPPAARSQAYQQGYLLGTFTIDAARQKGKFITPAIVERLLQGADSIPFNPDPAVDRDMRDGFKRGVMAAANGKHD